MSYSNPPIQPQDESLLVAAYRHPDTTLRQRDRIFQRLFASLSWLVRPYLGHGSHSLEADDLRNAARLGLHEALQSYDPQLGRLSTFARFHIHSAVCQAQRESNTIRLPVGQIARLRREERLLQDTHDQNRDELSSIRQLRALNQLAPFEPGTEHDRIGHFARPQEELLTARQTRDRLAAALLDLRQKHPAGYRVLTAHELRNSSFRELGKSLGLSHVRVQQICNRARQHLRASMLDTTTSHPPLRLRRLVRLLGQEPPFRSSEPEAWAACESPLSLAA